MHADSLKHHITHLEDLHKGLEKRLALLERAHKNDTNEVRDIKKKKLHVKDELARCRQTLETMLK